MTFLKQTLDKWPPAVEQRTKFPDVLRCRAGEAFLEKALGPSA
jgi:hypothetical protein